MIKNRRSARNNNSGQDVFPLIRSISQRDEVNEDSIEETLKCHQSYDHEMKIKDLKNIIDFILKNLIKINTNQVNKKKININTSFIDQKNKRINLFIGKFFTLGIYEFLCLF